MRNILIAIACLSFVPSISFTADHYVSPTGSDTWANSTNIATPTTPALAFANAAAGDTVYFRGGTYDVTCSQTFEHGTLEPTNSGTVGIPIVFMAYPAEIPILDANQGLAAWDDAIKNTQYCRILGINFNSYITYDGLHLIADGGVRQAELNATGVDGGEAAWSKGIVIKNMDISGGSNDVTIDTNYDLIRLEQLDGAVIQNNYLHDNRNSWGTYSEDDTCGIKLYDTKNLTISNNNIIDANTGIYIKSGNNWNNIYENNFIKNTNRGFYLAVGGVVWNATGNIFRNNLIIGTGGSFVGGIASNNSSTDYYIGTEFYNNTWYSTTSTVWGIDLGGGSGIKAYNNIICDTTGSSLYTRSTSATMTSEDHNNYCGHFEEIRMQTYTGSPYASLASWQASTELEGGASPGVGDIDTDPAFANGSGNLNTIADFAVSNTAGRSSGLLGADVSLIGVDAGTADTTAPPTAITESDPQNITANQDTITGTCDGADTAGAKWRIGAAPDATHGTACEGTAEFSCDTSGYSVGANTLYVGCYDETGNYSSDSITVNYSQVATSSFSGSANIH